MRRRDFLRGSLTLAGLGFCGCLPKSTPTRSPAGGRRDPSYEQGHRLRDGDLPEKIVETIACDGVVLGGGISGLSAGWRWGHAGFEDYYLLELEPEVGGNSRALHYQPTSAPIGAHYLPLPNTEASAVRRLLEEMGVLTAAGIDGRHLCHSRQERLFYEGSWHEGLVPEDVLSATQLAQYRGFRAEIEKWSTRRDRRGRKVFALPLHYSSTEEEFLALDRMSFAEYARRQGWTDPYLLWLLNYACRDDFGGSIHNCSAWAGLHYFASRDGGGLGDADQVLVWPEGNNRLVQFLRDSQKGKVKSRALVLAVDQTEGGASVDFLDLETQERKRLLCKVVAFCLPSFMRPYLMGDHGPVDKFVYAPWVTSNLVLDKTPADREPPGNIAWDNVIYDSASLGYVVATHQNLATDPNLPTVWTWYRPFPDEEPRDVRKRLLDSTWDSWAENILGELEIYHSDIRTLCRRLDVTVLGHGMIRPSVDFVWGESLAAARRSLGRVFYGHGDLSGMSLFEEAQFRGVRAAEDALAHLGFRSQSFL